MLYFFLQIFLKPPSTIKYCPRKNYIFICFFFKLFKIPIHQKTVFFLKIVFTSMVPFHLVMAMWAASASSLLRIHLLSRLSM